MDYALSHTNWGIRAKFSNNEPSRRGRIDRD